MTTDHGLEAELRDLPVLDAHTHLTAGRMAATGLQDVLLYHMVISDLYAAGCPSGSRLTQFPGQPNAAEVESRIEEAIPYLPAIRNTSSWWLVRKILAEIYDWTEPVTRDNWRRLDGLIRERSTDPGWADELLARGRIQRSVTELSRRGSGADDARLQYSLEWAFFTRCQWGEYDTALYELERCWGAAPGPPSPIGTERRPTERVIKTIDDVHTAVNYYVDAIPFNDVLSLATHLSTDIDYGLASADQMRVALATRSQAGEAERNIYAAYVNEAYLAALEQRSDAPVFQFSFGAEPLPYETGSRTGDRAIRQIAEMISRHPRLRFQCFLGVRSANQAFCTMSRELPNLSLAGYWWHNFFPTVIRDVMSERLDMVPLTKQIGFFSDAYTLEWSVAKLQLVESILASLLSERVARGQYSPRDALQIANGLLYSAPQELLGVVPRGLVGT